MNRFKQLDILRAIAVFLVLGRHMHPCPQDNNSFLHQISTVWARGGWVGVDLFFVLSGFLVSGLLFREHERYGELRVGHFLIRRGFKIYPPFWLLIGATIMLDALCEQDVSWSAVTSELLFVQNYGPSLWPHTWSLAVEEHFYFLLAAGLFMLAKRRCARPFALIPPFFIAVALACLTLRVLAGSNPPFEYQKHLSPSHLRLDGLFFGVFLSYLFHHQPARFLAFARKHRFPLTALGSLSLLLAFCYPLEKTRFLYTGGLTLFYLGSGCVLVAALGFEAPASRPGRALAYTGARSYAIYLWHMPIAVWGTPVVAGLLAQPDNWYLYATTYLVGSVVWGVGMAILIEQPSLELRDRLFPSRGTPLQSCVTEPSLTAAPQAPAGRVP